MFPDWQATWELIKRADRTLIVSHEQPDGDAIGSILGLGLAMREAGKFVELAVDGGLPSQYSFLSGSETIGKPPSSGDWDLLITLDCSDERRSGASGIYGREHSQSTLNIDHHVTNLGYAQQQLLMPEAVSTTEIIYRFLLAVGIPISDQVAQALLTGIITDTLGFRTDNVVTETLAIAQDLMGYGASLNTIMQNTLNQRPFSSLQLWQRVLKHVQLKRRLIWASIPCSDWQVAGVTPGSDGGLVGLLRQIKEASIAAVFIETKPNETEISLRCDFGYDVSALARTLGGGGHQQASGATIQASLDRAIEQVLPMLQDAADRGPLD